MTVYGVLPAPLKSVAASLRGWSLRRWRYGRDSERLVEEALEREQWTPPRWKAYQDERLAVLLRRAAKRVPYYREQWAERRRGGDRTSVENLQSWPVLTKETLRSRNADFVADDCDRGSMFHEHTSGTTGLPLNLWSSRETVRSWYALFEARARRWNGVTRHDRWAILGGQLVTPATRRRPPFWVWNAGLHQLYMSSYHLSPETVAAYIDALRRFRIRYLLGYASSLFSLAHLAREAGVEAPAFSLAISNAEPLYAHQRETIEAVFGCPVRGTYGMAEIASAASECASERIHLWPEAGYLEICDPATGGPAAAGEVGKLICTGLLNADMPLVRYEVGDLGSLAREGQPCACGRTLPELREVTGRLDDVIVTPEGRRVGRLDTVFKADMRIREAQVVQETFDDVRVHVVPAEGFGPSDAESIRRRLQDRLGPGIRISIEEVAGIPRTSAGKFRAVISRVGSAGSDKPSRAAGGRP
jgi:phenylacetate-CoA ligase